MMEGKLFKNKAGDTLKVIKVVNHKRVLIEYQDKHKYRYYVTKFNVLEGYNKNPYRPSVQGVGYIGDGEYNTTHKPYRPWVNLLSMPSRVAEEWYNYQTFAIWYMANRRENTKMKTTTGVYSPSTTIFVSHHRD